MTFFSFAFASKARLADHALERLAAELVPLLLVLLVELGEVLLHALVELAGGDDLAADLGDRGARVLLLLRLALRSAAPGNRPRRRAPAAKTTGRMDMGLRGMM